MMSQGPSLIVSFALFAQARGRELYSDWLTFWGVEGLVSRLAPPILHLCMDCVNEASWLLYTCTKKVTSCAFLQLYSLVHIG